MNVHPYILFTHFIHTAVLFDLRHTNRINLHKSFHLHNSTIHLRRHSLYSCNVGQQVRVPRGTDHRNMGVHYPRSSSPSLTSYMTSVHPSMVMHWKTVSMARPKLSKLVMPQLGPSHPLSQKVPLGHSYPRPHGLASSTNNSAHHTAPIISFIQ